MISVIIPTRDRPHDLVDCLRGLASQSPPPVAMEIIVVDDYSAMPYGDAALAFARAAGLTLRYLRNGGAQGAATARNIGARTSRGDVLAFLDDDAVSSPNWIEALMRALHDGADAVTGRIVARDGERMFSRARQLRYDRRQRAVRGSPSHVSFLAGGNAAVRRTVFFALGGFDETLTLMHDQDLAAKLHAAAHLCVYADDMVIAHRHYKDFMTMVVQTLRSARFRLLLERRHPHHERWTAARQLRSWIELLGDGRRSGSLVPALIAAALEAIHAVAYLVQRKRLVTPAPAMKPSHHARREG